MNAKELIRKASPVILTALAIFGVGATAYSAVKASKEVDEEIKEKTVNFTTDDGTVKVYKDLDKKERYLVYARHYYKPVLFGLGTVVCIVSANHLSSGNQALLTSAYALLQRTHNEYIDKVKDIFGEDAHDKVMEAIRIEHPNPDNVVDFPGFAENYTLSVDLPEEPHVFYDSLTDTVFESTMPAVLEATMAMNRNYILGDYVTVNDWLGFLGLPAIASGDDLSWYMESGVYWLDTKHSLMTLKDGTKAVRIDFIYPPVLRRGDDE